jgi:hypothetical protein
MTEAQTLMEEDVAPGTTDRSGTTEPKVLCLGDTYKCPLAGDPGRRRPGPESSGVRRIRRTDLYTDWGALSHASKRRCFVLVIGHRRGPTGESKRIQKLESETDQDS